MLGKRSEQKGLWEADRLYLDYVGKDTFYGLLASLRGQLFSDDDFADILSGQWPGQRAAQPAGHGVVLNDVHAVVANTAANLGAVRLGQLWSVILLTTALLPQLHFRIRAFRPGF